jgi:hypothetical protein
MAKICWGTNCVLQKQIYCQAYTVNPLVPLFLLEFIASSSGFILIGASVHVSNRSSVSLCAKVQSGVSYMRSTTEMFALTWYEHESHVIPLWLLSLHSWILLTEHKNLFLTELINGTNIAVYRIIQVNQHCTEIYNNIPLILLNI